MREITGNGREARAIRERVRTKVLHPLPQTRLGRIATGII